MRQIGSEPEVPSLDKMRPKLLQSKSVVQESSFDKIQDNFQDLESLLTTFQIDDTKKNKYKRRRSIASSMKFWKTKDDNKI